MNDAIMTHWAARETVHGHKLGIAASCLQKEIRRGYEFSAIEWAFEIYETDAFCRTWLFNRLPIIAVEDCGLEGARLVPVLRQLAQETLAARERKNSAEHLFLVAAVLLLAQAPKDRTVPEYTIVALEEWRRRSLLVPDYALDYHTAEGRARGATVADYFDSESPSGVRSGMWRRARAIETGEWNPRT